MPDRGAFAKTCSAHSLWIIADEYMLIGTNTDITYKEIKYGMGNISVGDYQPIYDSETVCKYVTKYIGKDVDYDIVFKS